MLLLVSCNDEFEGEIVRDNIPATPVTFEGTTTYGFNPYYTVSYAGNNFSITLKIPDNSPVKIKEVSNIVAGATSINAASLGDAKQYLTTAAAVNGTTYTLTTSITEFNSRAISSPVTAAPAAGALVERAFMFKLTMEDNSIIVPVQCRIRITP
ncbi:MAG: hypothetical protein KIT62_01715 [Cyclobacteriaceae bacterium]|nr:hypothetical protein [Cyclobacteriaceae bacterium]